MLCFHQQEKVGGQLISTSAQAWSKLSERHYSQFLSLVVPIRDTSVRTSGWAYDTVRTPSIGTTYALIGLVCDCSNCQAVVGLLSTFSSVV